MTIAIDNSGGKVLYTSNGVQTQYGFGFKVLNVNDIKVYEDGVISTANIQFNLNLDQDAMPGGTIDYLTSTEPVNGVIILIKRIVSIEQQTDYTQYGGFPAETHELALDNLTQIVQQQEEKQNRSLSLDISDDGTTGLVLPAYSARRALVWDATLKKLVNSINDPDTNSSAAAAASAAAALVSENNAAASEVNTAADAAATAADRISTNADAATASSAVTSTAADVVTTNADAAQTALDKASTNADALATAADKIATNADAASTAADALATAADKIATNADALSTSADATATAADKVATNADVVSTAADASSTAADLAATNQDTIDTAADVLQTAADLVATNQDTIDTAADLSATNASAAASAASAVASDASAVASAASAVSSDASFALANTEAIAAQSSRVATDALYTSFFDIYLGPFATAPTTDNSGNALTVGDLYFDSALDQMFVRNAANNGWNAVGGLSQTIGVWSPVLSDGSNNATMFGESGNYIKIGNIIFIRGHIQISSLGSVVSGLRITGLPEIASGVNSSIYVGKGANLAITAGQNVGGYITNGGTSIFLTLWDDIAGTTSMQATEFSSDGQIEVSGHYFI